MGGLMTAPLGVRLGAALKSNQLKRLMGVFMIFVAPTVPARGILQQSMEERQQQQRQRQQQVRLGEPMVAPERSPAVPRPAKVFATGLASGLAAGLFGIGGGAIVVPCLASIGNSDLGSYSHTDILATSLLSMSPPAILATWTQRRIVIWKLSAYLSVGSAAGGALTARFVESLEGSDKEAAENALRWLFASVMALMGARFAKG